MNGNRERTKWERFWHDVGTIAPVLLLVIIIFVPGRFLYDWGHGDTKSLLFYLRILVIGSALPISLYLVAACMRWWIGKRRR